MNNFPAILTALNERLDEARLSHTLAVAQTAFTLGNRYGLDEPYCEKLYLAGLLHDVTKNLSTNEHIKICRTNGISLTKYDLAAPSVLHAISGAIVAKRDFPTYADDTVCRAIALHTTGGNDMTLFDKIIYLSDYIEPTRKHPACIAAREAYLKELEQSDTPVTVLNRHLLSIIKATAKHLQDESRPIHPKTNEMIEFLKNELKQ